MTVTVNQVKSDIKIFADMSDDHVQTAINAATSRADADKISAEGYEAGVIAYAKYVLYIDWFTSNGGVTGASALGQSQTIANPNASSNALLLQYQDIVDRYGQEQSLGSFDFYD